MNCRAEDWAAKRADAAAQKQLKAKSSRREVFKRAEAYAKEYRAQVISLQTSQNDASLPL
jgi:Ribosomal L30 N-terminal domain